MTLDRHDIARYLRQLRELGVHEIVLDGMSAEDVIGVMSAQRLEGARDTAATGEIEPYASAANAANASNASNAANLADAAEPAGAKTFALVREALAPAAPAATPAAAPAAAPVPAASALTLLQQTAAACMLCGLHTTRSTVVFGEGDPAAEVVVVGEAPGQEEDRTGRPFVGRAGKLLDLLLMSAGFPREKVYICNVLKCRPPNNRNPMPAEVTSCTTSFLHGQLEAISPKVLLAVGKFAAQALLESDESIGRLRGVTHTYRGTPLIVTYHPAYLLRSPQMTRVAWQDFQLLHKVVNEPARS
jgi:uracil-DNA glycosylase